MKGLFLLGCLLPLFCFSQEMSGSKIVGESGIHFYKNIRWQKIQKKAKAQHKYIFVDCYTTWCGYCKEMDKTTFTDKNIGALVKESFLSVRLQCDSSKHDDESVKARYEDAHQFVKEYNLKSYPTYLFFSPEGELIHQGGGYLDSAAFVQLLKDARDPKKQYYALLKNYQQGKRDYATMPFLAKAAVDFNDSALVVAIHRDYIQNYLNGLSDSALADLSNLQLLRSYVKELRSNDRSFKWLGDHPGIVDSITKSKGFAVVVMVGVLYKEEVKPKLNIAKLNNVQPSWNDISAMLTPKIGNEATRTAIWKAKMEWYRFQKDWENYYAVVIESVDAGDYKDNPRDFSKLMVLNQVSMEILQHSEDKAKLVKALSWMNLVVDKMTDSSAFASDLYDTKAELLYKLERKDEALALEERAVKIAPNNKAVQDVYKKMREGKPTW